MTVEEAVFENFAGGAVLLEGGSLYLNYCNFTSNNAALGGGLRVTGGYARVWGCMFLQNTATEAGGALYVHGGEVLLGLATVMLSNRAVSGEGRSIALVSGSVTYQLPTPLGRWIFAPSGTATIDAGLVNDNYPFPCGAGLFGNSLQHSAQSGPQCSGLCPPGYFCAAATITPSPCPNGTYCPDGSPAAVDCPAGAFGWRVYCALRACRDCFGPVSLLRLLLAARRGPIESA